MKSVVGSQQQFVSSYSLQRAVLPFFIAAGGSFLLSVALWFSGQRMEGIFVGLWVPSILALGSLLIVSKERQNG